MPLPRADAETLTELRAMPISMLASDDWPNSHTVSWPLGSLRPLLDCAPQVVEVRLSAHVLLPPCHLTLGVARLAAI